MSKTVKLLNEGFEQKYMEKEVFHNDNGTDYDVIERSKSGQNALLNNGNQWIIAWNCPEDNKGSWGQGHYFFDEESARDAWERNYLSEAFDTDDDTVKAVCKECGTKGYAHKHTADENGEFTCSSCKKLHEDSTFDKSKAQKMFKKLRDLDDDGEDEKKDDLSFALKNANKTKHPLLIETPPGVGTLARIKAWCKMNGLKPVYLTKENPSLNKEVSSDTAIIVPDFDKMDARTRLAFESTMDKSNAGLVVAIVNSDSNLDAAERNMFTVLTVLDGEIFRDKYEKHTARMGANESMNLTKAPVGNLSTSKSRDTLTESNSSVISNVSRSIKNFLLHYGDKNSQYDSSVLQVYIDQSGSWGDSELGLIKRILSAVRGINNVKIEVYYFANHVHTDPTSARVEGGTGAFNEIMSNLNDTQPDNVLIVTDSDFDWRGGNGTYIAPGGVWMIFRDERSNTLMQSLKGKKLTKIYDIVTDRASTKNDDENGEDYNESLKKKIKRKDKSMNRKLPEDFNEKNLDKMSTPEWEANKNRQRRIEMYRKYAFLDEGAEITEDNISDYALNRVACVTNRSPEKVRAEILGQRYSDYEV